MVKPITAGIVGAGLAGLISAILLARKGFAVTVFEKKQFPFHRVCGEYISNEVLNFLNAVNLNPPPLNPSSISKLIVSSGSGKTVEVPLSMGGFGLSRFVFDEFLYRQALNLGVEFIFAKVTDIAFADEQFHIGSEGTNSLHFDLAIAAYGKRSNLDQKMRRHFFSRRSPFTGVKYHIKTGMDANLIRLDNFKGGYCGTCKIEDDLYNLCYLTESKNLKPFKSIPEMEQEVLFKNPHLKHIFNNSDFVNRRPEVISEISFENKTLVENHVLFCGDAAGMITPLCGNGMAMAIHSGKILAESIIASLSGNNRVKREMLESTYVRNWNAQFATRLKAGRTIQKLFLNLNLGNLAVGLMKTSPVVARTLVKTTHGKSF